MKNIFESLILILVAGLVMQSLPAQAQSDGNLVVDSRRSLIVSELSILKNFTLKRTMDQLAAQAAVPGLTGEKLFRQWFDILNPKAESFTQGPHCDDELDVLTGLGILNSFPFTCRPGSKFSEGMEASLPTNPIDGYVPITLTNRFDVAPSNGRNCGEHRIVYARSSGITDDRNRNFLIFEAALPNPFPEQGLKGCKMVVKFWAQLTKENDLLKRAKQLENFYYLGLAPFKPVVHIGNYGENPQSDGQIRTNQFMQPRSEFTSGVWTLREYKLRVTKGLSAVIQPATVKTNPFGPLFQSGNLHPLAAEFQDYFLTQVRSLATTDFSFNYVVPDRFNTGQSQANGAENNYVTQLGGDSSPFGQRIQEELDRLGSPLTPTEIVSRAQSQSCAGCHRLNSNPGFSEAQRALGGGLVFSTSLDFTHSGERAKEFVNGQEAWVISKVLTEMLLPARKKIMVDFLEDKLKHPNNPNSPINGKSHH
ncbi:MAG: hypothetical protein ACAH59_02570 [Pseudobdellovibrionaceae bacterium]